MSFTYQNDAVLDVIIIILFLNLKKMKSVNKKKKLNYPRERHRYPGD